MSKATPTIVLDLTPERLLALRTYRERRAAYFVEPADACESRCVAAAYVEAAEVLAGVVHFELTGKIDTA